MEARLAESCVLGADSGKPIQSMTQKLELPASAAVHSQEPLARFKKSQLTPGQICTTPRFSGKNKRVPKPNQVFAGDQDGIRNFGQ